MPKIKHTAEEVLTIVAHLPRRDGHSFRLKTIFEKNEFCECTVDSAKTNVQLRIYTCTLDLGQHEINKKVKKKHATFEQKRYTIQESPQAVNLGKKDT